MQLRTLGKTGLRISPIGFGAFKIGRNAKIKYPRPYDLPSDGEVHKLLNGLVSLGVSHFDTAPAYGLSEERLGRWLRQSRHSVTISTKVGERFSNGQSEYRFDADSVRQSVFDSLQKLGRDQLDLVLIHTPANDLEVLTQTDVVATLQTLKSEGCIKAIGLSGKTVAAAEASLGWADAIMVEFNAEDTSHQQVMQKAHQRGIGVVVKKGLASGHLPAKEAIPFVLRQPFVDSLIVGGLNLSHMRTNVLLASEAGRQPYRSLAS